MHKYIVPEYVNAAVMQRQGRLCGSEAIDVARAALVMVDMQNHFVAEGFPAEVAAAREIVSNINRIAASMRSEAGSDAA